MDEDAVFLGALEHSSAQSRTAYLERACGGDAALRRGVEQLLRAHQRAGNFLLGNRPVSLRPRPRIATEGPGSRIGAYRLVKQIGEGGFGVVYLAKRLLPVHRRVALKIIKPGMDSRQILARFETEQRAMTLLDHPHIASVYGGGATRHGRPYFVMEYVAGSSITEFCDAQQLPIPHRLRLFVALCRGIEHAHRRGIVHRDLKPSNVLIGRRRGKLVPKVIDFGLAKALHQPLSDQLLSTPSGQLLGSPLYMSPEQAAVSDARVDARADVYSLGTLLYELLTGTTPLEKSRLEQVGYHDVYRLIREEEPPAPSARLRALADVDGGPQCRQVRSGLDWIAMRALEKEPAGRYQSAGELADDVERYLAGKPVLARRPSLLGRLRNWLRF